MSRQRIIFLLGIWVAILPFLGFPRSWKNILFVITGLGLIYLAYLLRRERRRIAPQNPPYDQPDTYTDNGHEYNKIRTTNKYELTNKNQQPVSQNSNVVSESTEKATEN